MSFQIILIIHVLLALGLIALILMQHGKGADAGAAFGAGASGSVFGARGANSFMYKLTASVAFAFFVTSLTLAYLATNETSADNEPASIMESAGSVPIIPSDVPMIAPTTSESDISDIPE
ncbi:MAG: preprotein translocase subunit SecG [Candidatus Thioglobus sp.]|uniref:preprotein translocase subunit SecG n=1 Tax=Candidatus Thioglobus sp. TaxID=2026721 RepID=UPI0026179F04|nr:preprotein translocase subunit SecG [Candidatus Thioglobus sp.]MDC9727107.1 preprotein translocase subunit SecG [Candidatus Thioglobus sp.]